MDLETTDNIETRLADCGTELVCPRCRNAHLHHEGLKSFDRDEDAETIRLTEVAAGDVTTTTPSAKNSGNPSQRRDGLVISFRCEICSEEPDDILELTIAQHKGTTLLRWRYKPIGQRD